MDANTLFLIISLDLAGSKGWVPHTSNNPSKGQLAVTKDGMVIRFGYKFNGGNPRFFCTEAPKGFNDLLPEPFDKAQERV